MLLQHIIFMMFRKVKDLQYSKPVHLSILTYHKILKRFDELGLPRIEGELIAWIEIKDDVPKNPACGEMIMKVTSWRNVLEEVMW